MKKNSPPDEATEEGLAVFNYFKPAWAKAAVIAIRRTDTSFPQVESYSFEIEQIVVLAWSKHTRNNMQELRKAAATAGFKPTEHLATAPSSWEHKSIYGSWGGFFLGKQYYETGWLIRKVEIKEPWTHWAHFFTSEKAFSPLAQGKKPKIEAVKTKTVVSRRMAEGMLNRYREEAVRKQESAKGPASMKYLQDSIDVFDLCLRLVRKHVE